MRIITIRIINIIIILTASFGNAFSQPVNVSTPCYFDEFANNRSIQNTEKLIQSAIREKLSDKDKIMSADSVRTIPVVVHIIHTGGPENISLAQVQSQIRILNEDFGKISGSNGDGDGVDTKVRFCLAKIDPNGNCTDGIVRINSPLANHQTYQRALLKELSFWDNTRYLNIYVVKSINGNVGGYSSFPGGPADEDGVVVRQNLFGNIGTASSRLGRTTTHELGHWLGVYHVFNNGCGEDVCSDGDYVCDTPPAAAPHYNCNPVNSCSNDNPDVDDQIRNYMDYTPGNCKNMFTNGQSLRMNASLESIRTTIWSQENLVSTGCDSDYYPPDNCRIAADFVTLTPEICTGNSIYFMDKSLNNPASWQWSFPGGTPPVSTLQNPTIVYTDNGTYSVTLVVADSSSADSLTISKYIFVSPPGVGDPLYFAENFDSGLYPPPSGIDINNADGGVTWELDSLASVSGKYSIRINNLINTNYGSSDEIILPYFDFTSAEPDSMLYMSFDWAYAKSDPTFSDELLVLLSTDCGTNFDRVLYKRQSSLATGPTQTTPFVPDSSQWKRVKINLNSYKDETYVQIKIVNVTDGGNNLYIDNIYVGDGSDVATAVDEMSNTLNTISLFPNPANDNCTLEYFINKQTAVNISIYRLNGQLAISFDEGIKSRGTHRLALPTADWIQGMYSVRLRTKDEERSIKLIITQ